MSSVIDEDNAILASLTFICRDSQITNQIAVMNAAYSTARITWVLASTSRTKNSDWFNNVGPDTSEQMQMKSALRTGTMAVRLGK